jgi:NAD(P)H-hydrate epimerase
VEKIKKFLISTKEMRILDKNAEYFGISRLQLMENAGRSIAYEVISRFNKNKANIEVFCGLGGNGGDGFVAARHLISEGFKVKVFLAGRADRIVDISSKKNWEMLKNIYSLVNLTEIYDSSLLPELKAEVTIDALLGFGLKQNPRPPISQIIKKINETETYCISVDVPSGLDSDIGVEYGEAVKANLTISFHKKKMGLVKAKEFVGELIIKKIGIPEEIEKFTGPGDVIEINEIRPDNSYKGNYGRLLIIGGGEKYSGAPILSALAALRTGTDLVTIATPHKTAYSISSYSPNLITLKLSGENLEKADVPVIEKQMNKTTSIIIGPGLGNKKETKETVLEIIKIAHLKQIPILLDADGLNAFSEEPFRIKIPSVLTPHLREYKNLSGKNLSSDLDKRIESVKLTARDLSTVILLKSHIDIISDGEKTKINFTGNPGMTVGGTGDVLSGIVGSLLAKGFCPMEAATAGAFINGAAGDFVLTQKGYHIVASDIIDWIPKIMNDPNSHLKIKKNRVVF